MNLNMFDLIAVGVVCWTVSYTVLRLFGKW